MRSLPVFGVAAIALAVLPGVFLAIGLTLTSAIDVIIFAMAAMALNLLVGYTGLVSFGHGAWFGIAAYTAAILQLRYFPDQFWLPALGALALSTVLGFAFGALILRRSGVYFSLLTLAIAAIAYAIAFRWTSVTGGESGLGGLERGSLLGIDLSEPWVFYGLISLVTIVFVFFLDRVVRSPVGTVLLAIRENNERARFIGYDTRRYKLIGFTVSVMLVAVAGVLGVFNHRFVSPDTLMIMLSGEILAMVVIGGMRSFFGPAIGALFYMLFREYVSIWTENWLFWFGLCFVLFLLFSPEGIVGIAERVLRVWRPRPLGEAAMAGRRIREDAPFPDAWRPRDSAGDIPLNVRSISRNFAGLKAVDDVSLKLVGCGVVALVGPNGAGKTTAFNVISGMFVPSGGSVLLHGENIAGVPADRICRAGLARSFQITNLFNELSVFENIRLAVQSWHGTRYHLLRNAGCEPEIERRTREIIAYLGLTGLEEATADSLSYGGQRVVDLGLAIASRPSVLLLDEPLAGLSLKERERITELIRKTARHLPILVIEHDVDRAFGLAHHVTMLNEGRVLISDAPDVVRNDRRVQQIYTGTGKSTLSGRERAPETGEVSPLLKIECLNTFYGKSHILRDVDLEVRPGEIVGLLGRNGAGKSTLLKSVIGVSPAASGAIVLEGKDITAIRTPAIARRGVGYVPQGRGLFSGMSLETNMRLGRLGRSDLGAPVWNSEEAFSRFPRLKQRQPIDAERLSGGEQQMAAIARALAGPVKILLLDEPFEGLAPAIIEELFAILDDLRKETAIIIVEHNLDIVLALADRAYVLDRGAVSHAGPARALEEDLELRRKVLWV